MYLPKDAAEYVHEISYRLNEPRWWEEFKQLAVEQGVKHSHPVMGGWCHACETERIQRGELRYPDHYDY